MRIYRIHQALRLHHLQSRANQNGIFAAVLLKETGILIRKEWQLEMRQKYALGSLLLYVVSTIFVCYLSFQKIIDVATWNALFWIVLLFTATNAIARSFGQESRGNQLYQYSLIRPEAAILAKIIYNLGLMVVLTIISLVGFMIFMGSEALVGADLGMYTIALLLGSMGFSAVLTMISAIASKTENNIGLMAILGFPVILPLLLTVMKATRMALNGFPWQENLGNLLILGLINVLVIALAFILFPYLWRE